MASQQVPGFAVEGRAGLLDFWAVYERQGEHLHETAMDVALRHPDFAALVRARNADQLREHAQRSRVTLRQAVLEDDWPPYIAQIRLLGARYAKLGVTFASWYRVGQVFRERLIPALVEAYGTSPARLTASITATLDFLDFSTALVAEPYFETLHQERFEQLGEAERRGLEDRFRALADATPDSIITAEHHGLITYANRATETLFGRGAAALVGQPLTVLMPERLHRSHAEGLARFLESREPRMLGKTLELPALRADGTEILVEMSIATWEARGGPSFAAIIRDISERKQIEATLEQRTHQLEDANRELEAFSYSVAHDLRAPLRGMSGFSQMLLEDHASQLGGQGIAHLLRIQANVRRMGTLIDALFGLSRLSRGDLELQPVDLTGVARSVIAQLAAADPRRVVEVSVEDGLRTTADPRLMRNLLENLIGNAWKFTARTPAARIAVGSTDPHTFFVRDNGAGFDLMQAGKLFSPFERLHSADDFPGTGVGLATVQRIVHRHGGRIWVTAQVNAGATFFFTFAPADP